MKSLLSVLALAFAFAAGPATADTLHLKDGSVEFEAVSTSGVVHIHGKNAKPTGDVTVAADGKASGTITVELADLTTGMGMRDGHMRDKYLETTKYPKATLVLDPVKPSSEFSWTGKLTLKDVTKPVSGKAWLTGDDLEATFSVVLDDFKVGVPEYLGVTVAKEVNIKVKAKASK